MYVRVTLDDGSQYVSEFSKMRHLGRYAAQVMSGMRPFNVWVVTGTTHPASGEKVLFRTRRLVSGRRITSMEEVLPVVKDHELNPEYFEPVSNMPQGKFGFWVAPEENTPEGAVAGVKYPVHQDQETWQKYVILHAPTDEADQEVRYVLSDPNGFDGGEGYAGDSIEEGEDVPLADRGGYNEWDEDEGDD